MNNLKVWQELGSSEAKVEQLIKLTTGLLSDLIEEDEGICQSPFNSNSVPNISIADFLRRLHRYTRFSS